MHPENGEWWHIKHCHYYGLNRRLGMMVNNGGLMDRVNAARSDQHWYVPFLFDIFMYAKKAPRVWTYEQSPIRFLVRFNTMEYITERIGAAQGVGGIPVAGYTPGTLQEVRLACRTLILNRVDEANLTAHAPTREIYFRELSMMTGIPHASTTNPEVIDLDFQNTAESFWIVPHLNRFNVDPWTLNAPLAGRLGAPDPADVLEPFNFSGEYLAANDPNIALVGANLLQFPPFAGAVFRPDETDRMALSYWEMTDKTGWESFPHNTRDLKEMVAKMVFPLYPVSADPSQGLQLTRITKKVLRIYWTFNGITVPNWNGTFNIYGQQWNFLIEGQKEAKIAF